MVPPYLKDGMTKSRNILGPRVYWTPEQETALRTRYADERTEVIAADIGRPVRGVYQKAKDLGLRKSAAFLASPASGRTNGRQGIGTRFEKGQAAWNKGMKGLQIGGEATQFKAGTMPHNHVPVGTVVMATDGYLKVKVAEPKQWRWLHRMNWEETHGPIPKGMTLIFKDGKHENCAVDNLELLSRADLMKRNTVHNLPKELAEIVQLRGALNRQINKRMKNG